MNNPAPPAPAKDETDRARAERIVNEFRTALHTWTAEEEERLTVRIASALTTVRAEAREDVLAYADAAKMWRETCEKERAERNTLQRALEAAGEKIAERDRLVSEANEKASEQGRHAVELFDEVVRVQKTERESRAALEWAMDEVDILSNKLCGFAYPQGMAMGCDREDQQSAYVAAVYARREALASLSEVSSEQDQFDRGMNALAALKASGKQQEDRGKESPPPPPPPPSELMVKRSWFNRAFPWILLVSWGCGLAVIAGYSFFGRTP